MQIVNINEYFRENNDIYIRNRTHPLGIVSLALGRDNNKSFPLPKKTDPIVLTNYFPKKDVEESTGFREMVQKGIIELLSQEEYEMYSRNSRGRIDKEASKLISKTDRVEPTVEATLPVITELTEDVNINSRVLQMMHVHNIEDTSDVAGVKPTDENVIDELETMDLSEEDIAYILTHSRGRVKAFAQAMISSNREQPGDKNIEQVLSNKKKKKSKKK